MRYRIHLIITLLALTSGCSSLKSQLLEGEYDELATSNTSQHAVIKLPLLPILLKSEKNGVKKDIKFCKEIEIPARVSLTMRFDCDLGDKTVNTYTQVFEKYHHQLIEATNQSSLSKYLNTTTDLCVSIVENSTQFLRNKPLSPCAHIVIPHLEQDTKEKSNSEFDESAFFHISILRSYYPFIFHELYHTGTEIQYLNRNSAIISEEYHAYILDNFVSNLISQLVTKKPFAISINYDENSQKTIESYLALCKQPEKLDDFLSEFHSYEMLSVFGLSLHETETKLIAPSTGLLNYYYLWQFQQELSTTEQLRDILQSCNPSRLTSNYALKLQLLDFDFSEALHPGDNVKLNAFNHHLSELTSRKQSPFENLAYCNKLSYLPLTEQLCQTHAIDQVALQLYRLNDFDSNNYHLPNILSERLEHLKQDWLQLNPHKAKLNSNGNLYELNPEGRFTNSYNWVADTGAPLNVFTSGENECSLDGEMAAKGLFMQTVSLKRCNTHEQLGVIWKNEKQRENVIGFPYLAHTNAIMSKSAINPYEPTEKIPYIYYQGMPIIQQHQNGVRLNLCFDTGSKRSYITPRYRDRYLLTKTEIVKRLQNGKLEITINNKKGRVSVLNHNAFIQCDVIVGSDLVEIYSAVQFTFDEVNLWY
ncbi:hypothetical protein QWY77_00500 [Thalassotalea ponticola]|uniref:hypothetical protein n=1 Tax=Thalassotalea ponticola TaxID=1523392 RepID=UPI0025B470C0|nr:hypothetical protein [Thalassotalea ponticola]MDN3651263.1 hypothetical protein [Thalassotalea ponticola]